MRIDKTFPQSWIALLALGVLAFATACLPIPEPPPLPADTLPDQLTDAEFWRMVTEFSEPGGQFVYENFISNEIKYQQVLPELTQRVQSGGVYLGVASEQNFTYIAALRSKLAFIVDIRRQNMLEHLMYKALFEISEDRGEFVSRLFSRRPSTDVDDTSTVEELFASIYSVGPSDEIYVQTRQAITDRLVVDHGFALSVEDLEAIEFVLDVFRRGGPGMDYGFNSATPSSFLPSYYRLMVATDGRGGRNWAYLADEDAYRYVREMQGKNLIVPLVGDFAGPQALKAVAGYLDEHGAIVTAFYISNVEDYLPNSWPGYRSNLLALPVDDASHFIHFYPQRMLIRPMSDIRERWPGRSW